MASKAFNAFTEKTAPVDNDTFLINDSEASDATKEVKKSKIFSTAQNTKLSGIETGATADQSDAEIKTAYENNADTNVVTDAEKTILGNTSGANTGDMSDADVKTAYENNADTNEFNNAEQTLLGLQSGTNTGDQAHTTLTDMPDVGGSNTDHDARYSLLPENFDPVGIDFGNATQQYDIDGETWVFSTDGTPNAADHLLPACLAAIATAYDSSELKVREGTGAATGTNPNTVQFTWTGITTFNIIKTRIHYDGSASHTMVFELWNGGSWDTFIHISDIPDFELFTAEVLVPATYVIGGTVLGRFRHEQSGNAGHHLEIDYLIIGTGGGGGGGAVQTAEQTPTSAAGDIAATNVQDALEELDTEKSPLPNSITITEGATINLDIASWVDTRAKSVALTRTTITLNLTNFPASAEFYWVFPKDNTNQDLVFTLGGADLVYDIFDPSNNVHTRATAITIAGTDANQSWYLSFLNTGIADGSDTIIQVVGTIDSFA